MSDEAKAKAAMAEIQKYLAEHFDPLWDKVAAHVMIGGAVRTFWNEEDGGRWKRSSEKRIVLKE